MGLDLGCIFCCIRTIPVSYYILNIKMTSQSLSSLCKELRAAMCSPYVHLIFTICSLYTLSSLTDGARLRLHFLLHSYSTCVLLHFEHKNDVTIIIKPLYRAMSHCVFTICSLYAHHMFTICSLYTLSSLTDGPRLRLHFLLHSYSTCVLLHFEHKNDVTNIIKPLYRATSYYVFTICSPYIHHMFTICSLYTFPSLADGSRLRLHFLLHSYITCVLLHFEHENDVTIIIKFHRTTRLLLVSLYKSLTMIVIMVKI